MESLEELAKLRDEVEKARLFWEEKLLKCREEAEKLIPQLKDRIQGMDSKIAVLQSERVKLIEQLKMLGGYAVAKIAVAENVLPIVVTPAMYAKVVDDIAENCECMEIEDLSDEAKRELVGMFGGKTFKVVEAKITGRYGDTVDLTVEEVRGESMKSKLEGLIASKSVGEVITRDEVVEYVGTRSGYVGMLLHALTEEGKLVDLGSGRYKIA